MKVEIAEVIWRDVLTELWVICLTWRFSVNFPIIFIKNLSSCLILQWYQSVFAHSLNIAVSRKKFAIQVERNQFILLYIPSSIVTSCFLLKNWWKLRKLKNLLKNETLNIFLYYFFSTKAEMLRYLTQHCANSLELMWNSIELYFICFLCLFWAKLWWRRIMRKVFFSVLVINQDLTFV